MPLLGMSDEAREEVRRLHRRGLGAVRIARELEKMRGAGELPDPTQISERAVGRQITKLRKMPDAEQQRYDEVVWPESFGSSDLPYASAAVILELTLMLGRPPLAPLARWYWRTCQAFPAADVETVRNIAYQLALAEGDAAKVREVGADAVAGRLVPGGLLKLGPLDPDKPESVDRLLRQLEIYGGAMPAGTRQRMRQLFEEELSDLKEGANDES